MGKQIEFGVTSYGDIGLSPDGKLETSEGAVQNIVAEAQYAEELGLDFYRVGEHHVQGYVITNPEILLSYLAAKTNHIKLGSSSSLLAIRNPKRLFDCFVLLNELAAGRMTVTVGRGSYPLNDNYDMQEYYRLTAAFDEKLEQFLVLYDAMKNNLENNTNMFEIALATSARIETLTLAIKNNLPVIIGMGGMKISDYRSTRELIDDIAFESKLKPPSVGVYGIGYIAPTDQEAVDEFYPGFREFYDSRIKGTVNKPLRYNDYSERTGGSGTLLVGSPEKVAKKIISSIELFKADNFQIRFSMPQLTLKQKLRSLELYATQVIPLVRAGLPENFEKL